LSFSLLSVGGKRLRDKGIDAIVDDFVNDLIQDSSRWPPCWHSPVAYTYQHWKNCSERI